MEAIILLVSATVAGILMVFGAERNIHQGPYHPHHNGYYPPGGHQYLQGPPFPPYPNGPYPGHGYPPYQRNCAGNVFLFALLVIITLLLIFG